MQNTVKVYLSGPFDAATAKAQCAFCGLEAVSPIFDAADGENEYDAMKRLMPQCDALLVNANEAPGCDEPDSGAAFECGYAYALKKRIYCYLSDTRAMREKYTGQKTVLPDGMEVDEQGRWFEQDCLNLMLFAAASTIVEGNLAAAAMSAAAELKGGAEDVR